MMESAKSTVYPDATIPSFMFDDRESLRYPCEITRKWWREESGRYDILVSRETIAELSRGDYPKKEEVRRFLASLRALDPNASVTAIAEEYVKHMVMPADSSGDAAHLAYASYYGIDFLLTWNCSHLANARKRSHQSPLGTRDARYYHAARIVWRSLIMYTNELLEAKREAQRALLKEAEETGKSYFDVVDEAACRWFEEAGLTIQSAHIEPKPLDAPKK